MLGLAGLAAARPRQPPKKIVFPVLGHAQYTDDFGAPRPQGRHQGNDIMASRKALALAVEPGRVKFWTSSSAAGCMLYLYGASGTTYYYIHLNNDLGRGNDNRGRCVPGTAYAKGLRSGSRVAAGQPVGFVGDSGDANGIQPHLHFELHPGGGHAVSPYRWLRTATHLLYAAPPDTVVYLALKGTVLEANEFGNLRILVNDVRTYPMGQHTSRLRRPLVLEASSATVQSVDVKGHRARAARLDASKKGQRVKIWTLPQPTSHAMQQGDDLALEVALAVLTRPSR
ncbi:MAG: M23 family metallopeptidase [Actinomycetota bacterium]|nr:M23 family metallopeptidase [Actinomycetota bacterium]